MLGIGVQNVRFENVLVLGEFRGACLVSLCCGCVGVYEEILVCGRVSLGCCGREVG